MKERTFNIIFWTNTAVASAACVALTLVAFAKIYCSAYGCGPT